MVVGYGSNDRTKTNKIESEKIIVHPGYIAGEKADVALVKLKKPIPNATPISFADAAKEQEPDARRRQRHRDRLGGDLGLPGVPECGRRHGRAQAVSEEKLLSNEELEAPRKLHEVDIEVIDPERMQGGLRIAAGAGLHRRRHRDLRHRPDRRQGFLLRR